MPHQTTEKIVTDPGKYIMFVPLLIQKNCHRAGTLSGSPSCWRCLLGMESNQIPWWLEIGYHRYQEDKPVPRQHRLGSTRLLGRDYQRGLLFHLDRRNRRDTVHKRGVAGDCHKFPRHTPDSDRHGKHGALKCWELDSPTYKAALGWSLEDSNLDIYNEWVLVIHWDSNSHLMCEKNQEKKTPVNNRNLKIGDNRAVFLILVTLTL